MNRAPVNRALLAIVTEGFFSRLSFGLISFALPLYAYRLGLSLTAIGLLTSLNLAVALALKPIAGAAADRFGRKMSFTVAIVLRSAVSLLLAFATLPWQLFATRTLHGVSIALRDPAANALIADHGSAKAIASAFAWYQTAKSVAGALGKTAAGLLLTLTASDFSVVFGLAFVLSLVPVFLVSRYVRDAEGETAGVERFDRPVAQAEATSRVEGSDGPRILPFAGLGFLISGTAYMLANLFPVLAVEYAGLSEAEAGLVYSLSAVVVLNGPVFGWLSDNVSRRLVLSIRSAANICSSLAYLSPTFPGMIVGRTLDDLGKAAFRPAWGALMANVSSFDQRRRARTMGYLTAGEDAGEIAGPIVAGFLWSMWGVPVLLGVRVAVAVVTELYTVMLTRALDSDVSPRGPLLSVRRRVRSDRMEHVQEDVLAKYTDVGERVARVLEAANDAAAQSRNAAEADARRLIAEAEAEARAIVAEGAAAAARLLWEIEAASRRARHSAEETVRRIDEQERRQADALHEETQLLEERVRQALDALDAIANPANRRERAPANLKPRPRATELGSTGLTDGAELAPTPRPGG
jgi:MFS family permease